MGMDIVPFCLLIYPLICSCRYLFAAVLKLGGIDNGYIYRVSY